MYSIGTDIVKINRIRKLSSNKKFLNKIFTIKNLLLINNLHKFNFDLIYNLCLFIFYIIFNFYQQILL